jgi:hypothetical protein
MARLAALDAMLTHRKPQCPDPCVVLFFISIKILRSFIFSLPRPNFFVFIVLVCQPKPSITGLMNGIQ